MPRWFWVTLTLSLGLLLWLGLQSPTPSAIEANSLAASCPLPDKFKHEHLPLQSDIGNRINVFQLGGANITPLAGFSLQARVLRRENYRLDAGAEFSPIDLALGWGPMAEPGMATKLNVSQSGRFYRYSWGNEGPPIPLETIISHSANMHLVPGNQGILNTLEKVSADDVVELDGWLIRIEKNDGWHWQSSMTREDSGGGACELFYVCAVTIER
jgi:hypothetical protein